MIGFVSSSPTGENKSKDLSLSLLSISSHKAGPGDTGSVAMTLLLFSNHMLPGNRGLLIPQAWWIMGKSMAFWVEIMETSTIMEDFQSDSYLESSVILHLVREGNIKLMKHLLTWLHKQQNHLSPIKYFFLFCKRYFSKILQLAI